MKNMFICPVCATEFEAIAKDTEIERLGKELESADRVANDWARQNVELRAEIERLRHEVTLREQICADATLYARRLQEADDEIERLKAENQVLAETITVMEMLPEIVKEEKDAEIGRLRELLREAHLALSFMPDPTRKLLDLRYRVREALGE